MLCKETHAYMCALQPFPLPAELPVLYLTEPLILHATSLGRTDAPNCSRSQNKIEKERSLKKRLHTNTERRVFLDSTSSALNVKTASCFAYIQKQRRSFALFASACYSVTHRSANSVGESGFIGQSAT